MNIPQQPLSGAFPLLGLVAFPGAANTAGRHVNATRRGVPQMNTCATFSLVVARSNQAHQRPVDQSCGFFVQTKNGNGPTTAPYSVPLDGDETARLRGMQTRPSIVERVTAQASAKAGARHRARQISAWPSPSLTKKPL